MASGSILLPFQSKNFPIVKIGSRYFPSPCTLIVNAEKVNQGTIEISNEFEGLLGSGANPAEEETAAVSAS
jgi:hypothetical protein